MRSAAAAIAAPQNNSTTATTCFTPGSPWESTIIERKTRKTQGAPSFAQASAIPDQRWGGAPRHGGFFFVRLRVFVSSWFWRALPRQEPSDALEEGLRRLGLDGGGCARRAMPFELLATAAGCRRNPFDARRVAEHDAAERLDADLEQLAVGDRRDRGTAAVAGQERHLTEERAAVQARHLAFGARDRDDRLAASQHEHRRARLAFARDRFAGAVEQAPRHRRELAALRRRQRREDLDVVERARLVGVRGDPRLRLHPQLHRIRERDAMTMKGVVDARADVVA